MKKTSWEVREWVEEALPEIARRVDVNWSEAHFDKFTKDYDELHRRDSFEWIPFKETEKIISEYITEKNFRTAWANTWRKELIKKIQEVKPNSSKQ